MVVGLVGDVQDGRRDSSVEDFVRATGPVVLPLISGAIDAFGRSRQLVRGNGWQVFGVIAIVFIVVAVAQGILGAIGSGISGSLGVLILFNVISSTITAPVVALVAAVIYFGLRDIEGAQPAT